MLKRINNILNIMIGVCFGVFTGYGVAVFLDYKTHPDLYVMRSAPWYTGILLHGIVAAAVLVVLIIIKFIIRLKYWGHISEKGEEKI